MWHNHPQYPASLQRCVWSISHSWPAAVHDYHHYPNCCVPLFLFSSFSSPFRWSYFLLFFFLPSSLPFLLVSYLLDFFLSSVLSYTPLCLHLLPSPRFLFSFFITVFFLFALCEGFHWRHGHCREPTRWDPCLQGGTSQEARSLLGEYTKCQGGCCDMVWCM